MFQPDIDTADSIADDEPTFTIVTPDEADPQYDVRIWTKDGYTRVSDNGSEADHTGPAYVHHLLACLDTDPHEVFGDGQVAHHECIPRLDAAEYVEALDASKHSRLHAHETWTLDDHTIPVRREAGEVPEDERVEVEQPDDLSRFAMGPRADSPIHETDDGGTEGTDA
jgi:hypothetical protein